MEEAGELEQIVDQVSLGRVLDRWEEGVSEGAIGYILSLEGADSIRTPDRKSTRLNSSHT